MIVFDNLDAVKFDPQNVLTVGTFDGVHLGHQYIIRELLRYSKKLEGLSTVITFHPHPQVVLARPDRPPVHVLSTIADKAQYFRQLGLEKLVVIPFTREFASLSSETYVDEILCRKIGMQAILIGYDHHFGKGREGGIDTLKRIGLERGFLVSQLAPFQLNGEVVSSSKIRTLLLQGEIARANALLGRSYRLRARVVQGDGRGKSIGVPTANLSPIDSMQLIPARGVYAVQASIRGEEYFGMANIGTRPTFAGTRETLEVHVFDFSQEIYSEEIIVYFHTRLRDEKKFSSVEALKQQLRNDKIASLTYFANLDHRSTEMEELYATRK